MGKQAKNLMKGGGPGPGKVAIKKTVNRKGKSFQQTFYVSPQEAMAMQRKARGETDEGKEKKKGAKVDTVVSTANRVFETQRWKSLEKALTTPDLKGNTLPEPPPFNKHREIVRSALKQHLRGLHQKLDTLKKIAPPGSEIIGRVKLPDSALGKLKRKPKYGTADKLQDLTGTRVVAKTSQDVLDIVARMREHFEIVEEDDYITPIDKRKFKDPKLRDKTAAVMDGGYRSYHLIAKANDGTVFEVQVRTENQNTWANWAHDIYKPRTADQAEFVKNERAKKEVEEYGRQMSFYFESLDNPVAAKSVKPPPCPKVIATSPFGCIS